MLTSPFGHRPAFSTSGTGVAVALAAYAGVCVDYASTANIADFAAASTTMDGGTLVEGNTVLLKDQSTGSQNGLYFVDSVSGSSCALVRMRSAFEAGQYLAPGFEVHVGNGTANADGRFKLTGTSSKLIGADALTFSRTSDTITLGKRQLVMTQADLTDADGSQALNIGAVLPANARILGVEIHSVTPFSGGSVGDFTVDIGTADDVDALIDGADLFSAAVDGQAATRPLGIAPNKLFATAGKQLIATFICGSDDVKDATAGGCTIDVIFAQLA